MRPYYRFCRFFCQWFFLLFCRVRVFGREHVPGTGGILLVCNHQSFFDPVLVTMALYREGNYMARDTLFQNPLFRRFIKSLNAFPIRRNTADISAVKETLRRLKSGRVVVIFPEGTRTRDGSVAPFLPGPAAVALKARCAVVPVRIDGAFLSWPKNQALPSPAPIQIRYGPALTADQTKHYTAQELAQELRRRIIGLDQGDPHRFTHRPGS